MVRPLWTDKQTISKRSHIFYRTFPPPKNSLAESARMCRVVVVVVVEHSEQFTDQGIFVWESAKGGDLVRMAKHHIADFVMCGRQWGNGARHRSLFPFHQTTPRSVVGVDMRDSHHIFSIFVFEWVRWYVYAYAIDNTRFSQHWNPDYFGCAHSVILLESTLRGIYARELVASVEGRGMGELATSSYYYLNGGVLLGQILLNDFPSVSELLVVRLGNWRFEFALARSCCVSSNPNILNKSLIHKPHPGCRTSSARRRVDSSVFVGFVVADVCAHSRRRTCTHLFYF